MFFIFFIYKGSFSLEIHQILYYDYAYGRANRFDDQFFDKTSIAGAKLKFGDITAGDTIRIEGSKSDFTQNVVMMEFNHRPAQKANLVNFSGIKFSEAAMPFDLIYKVIG